MSKINQQNLKILAEQNSVVQDRLINNFYLPFEIECFNYNNYCSKEEELELKKSQNTILTIQWLLFLGIVLLNFCIHLAEINEAVQKARINSVQQLVNMNRY